MKNKKGFTLIELLAVIVILAIIALIATPIILNMINDAKMSAAKDSAYGYIKAIENYQALSILDNKKNPPIESDNDIDISIIEDKVIIKGTKPTGGIVSINNETVESANLCINKYDIEYNKNGNISINGKCSNVIIPVVKKEIYTKLQLENEDGMTYINSDEEVATVNDAGLVITKKSGTVTITILKNNEKFKKYILTVDKEKKLLDITGGFVDNKDVNQTIINQLYNVLTDGNYENNINDITFFTKKNIAFNYKDSYLYFTVNTPITITFSGKYYHDSGGTTGQMVIFNKINSNGDETEYITFKAEPSVNVSAKQYRTVDFEPGNYVLKPSGNYVIFTEWEINEK